MRNTLIGGALAAVLVVALFVAAQHWHKPAVGGVDAKNLSPTDIVKALSPDFVGQQKIGTWTLVCGPVKELPHAPPLGGHDSGNSEGTAPKETPPPPGWHIPRCRAMLGMRSPKNPNDEIRVTFRAVGFKRVLAMFLRFPPDQVETGDPVSLQLDQTTWQVPIRTCAKAFCLSIQSIKFADVPTLLKAKSLKLEFKPTGGNEQIAIPIPTDGLAQAIDAIHKIDK
jgi:Invasion associated locus B (IalB) protein